MKEYYCSYDLELCHSDILEKQIVSQFQKVQRGEFLIVLPSRRATEQWQKKLLQNSTLKHSAFKKDSITSIDEFFRTLYESESLGKGSSHMQMNSVHFHFLFSQIFKSLSSKLYMGPLWSKASFFRDLEKILGNLKSEVFANLEMHLFPKKEIWEHTLHSLGVQGRLMEKCEDLYRIWVSYETQKKKLGWIDFSDLKKYLVQHSESVRKGGLAGCEKIFLLGFQSLSHIDLLALSAFCKEEKKQGNDNQEENQEDRKEEKADLFISFFLDPDKEKTTERLELFESGKILREKLNELNFQSISSSISSFSWDSWEVNDSEATEGEATESLNKKKNKKIPKLEWKVFHKIARQVFSQNPSGISVLSDTCCSSYEEITRIIESEEECKQQEYQAKSVKELQKLWIVKTESAKEEILSVAKKIRTLLFEEEELKLSDIALVCPGKYKRELKRVFRSFEIPIEGSVSSSLMNQNLVRTILSILEIRIFGLNWDSCLNFLRSNYVFMKAESVGKKFQEDMHKLFKSQNTRIIVQEILRYQSKLGKKRNEENPIETLKERYNKKFQGSESENQGSEQKESDKREKKQLELCIQFLEEFEKRIQRFPSPESKGGSAYEYARLLEQAIIEDFAILYNAYAFSDLEVVRRDSIVLDRFLEVFKELAYCYSVFSDCSVREWYDSLRDILSHLDYQDYGTGLDSVHLLSKRELLGLSYQKIFVLGFLDGEFPSTFTPSMFRNSERNQLKSFLKTSKKHRELENFLFYTLFLSSREEIYFFYSVRDEELRETLHSFFLVDLFSILKIDKHPKDLKDSKQEKQEKQASLLEAWWDESSDAGLYFEFSSKGELYSDYAGLVWSEDLHPEYKEYKKYFQDSGVLDSKDLARIETKIQMEKKRSLGVFSEYEGILKGELLQSHFKERFRHLSVSQLERYAECPSRFFFHDVLGIRKEVSEPMRKGIAVHEILRQFYLQLYPIQNSENISQKELFFPKRESIESITEKEIRRKVETITCAYFEKNAPEWIWKNQIQDLVEDLSYFIQKDLELNAPYRPIFLEKECTWNLDSDFQVKGRIDRIDLNPESGQFRVIDYKSSKSAPKEPVFQRKIQEGYSFQPFVYTETTKEILESDLCSLSVDPSIVDPSMKEKIQKTMQKKISGSWNEYKEYYVLKRLVREISSRSQDLNEKVADGDISFRELSQYYMQSFVDRIRNGKFPGSPRDCSCEFSGVCRVDKLVLKEKELFWEDSQQVIQKLRDRKA